MMITNPFIKYTDKVAVLRESINGKEHKTDYITVEALKSRLNNDLLGVQEVRLDQTFDLTALGAKFLNAFTIPSGAILDSVNANIEMLVVASGTTVKVALGDHAGTTNAYGLSADLLKNTKISTLIGTVLAGATPIDICGVTTAGTALGSANITAGSVRVCVTYRIANNLPDAL